MGNFYTDFATITRSIPDELFNAIVETRMSDEKCSLYNALTSCVYKLAQILTDSYLQSVECEFIDDMGYRIKIER